MTLWGLKNEAATYKKHYDFLNKIVFLPLKNYI